MPAAADLKKCSVSMPLSMAEDVRARVGARGFSAYVAGAVARQLERDALDDLLRRLDAEHGSADEEEIAAIMARLAR